MATQAPYQAHEDLRLRTRSNSCSASCNGKAKMGMKRLCLQPFVYELWDQAVQIPSVRLVHSPRTSDVVEQFHVVGSG